MRDLKTANHLLRDRAQLAEAFKEQGYLFFRQVLDASAVARLRDVFLDTLREIGVVDEESEEPIWNGASLDDFSKRMRALTAKQPWKIFRDDPKIRKWLHEFMCSDYTWLPSIVYRVTPPDLNQPANLGCTSRFKRIHQDGYDWLGLSFLVFWVPLMPIDHQVGGMIIAEGCHKNGFLHGTTTPTMFEVAREAIPDDAWTRADFKPGDLVVQHLATPHTGISNQSNRFRMSMDFRLVSKSVDHLKLGTILAIDSNQLAILSEYGQTIELGIDDETYCPGRYGSALQNNGCIPRGELQQYLPVGSEVIVTVEKNRARLIRGFDIGHRA